ncbi:phytanoyl-CoA dioxygenase family protein [Deltaproteobacteria bacterium TL4]
MDQQQIYYERIKKDGYVVLENVLTSQECQSYVKLLEDLHQQYSSLHANLNQASKHGLDNKASEKIVYNLHNKNQVFTDLLDHPVVYPLLAFLLQEGSYENAEPFIHILSSARSPLKEGTLQQLHIDSRFPGSPFALTGIALFCLEDFRKSNGATRVIPGSHRYPAYPENGKQYDEEVVLEAPRGSVIVYNGSLWHGGGQNQEDSTRWSIIYSYARWFIKPSFNFSRNMPQPLYDRLTDRQKDILGYRCNPPLDEFTRISARSTEFEVPEEYQLPSH